MSTLAHVILYILSLTLLYIKSEIVQLHQPKSHKLMNITNLTTREMGVRKIKIRHLSTEHIALPCVQSSKSTTVRGTLYPWFDGSGRAHKEDELNRVRDAGYLMDIIIVLHLEV